MCRLRNIAMHDYQVSVSTGQTNRQTHRQTSDKVIPMCCYASQATQKYINKELLEIFLSTYIIVCGSFYRCLMQEIRCDILS